MRHESASSFLGSKPVKSPNAARPTKLLAGHVRAFCTNDQGREDLIKFGFDERLIFQAGCGAENLSACLSTYRDRAGWLVMPTDARELGSNKKEISEAASDLEKAKIRILDLSHPEDDTYSAIIQRGHVAISRARFSDPRAARRQGRWGGTARGEAAAAKRNAIMADDAVRRLVAHPKLTFADCAEILGPPFSESTLRRNYGSKPNAQTSKVYSAKYGEA